MYYICVIFPVRKDGYVYGPAWEICSVRGEGERIDRPCKRLKGIPKMVGLQWTIPSRNGWFGGKWVSLLMVNDD